MRATTPQDVVLHTTAYACVGPLLLLFLSQHAPSDADWDDFIAFSAQHPLTPRLVLTRGGAPNATQRARLAASLARLGTPPPVALLTESAINRMVLTAIDWLLSGKQPTRAFATTELREAVSWLGATSALNEVGDAFARLESSIEKGAGRAR